MYSYSPSPHQQMSYVATGSQINNSNQALVRNMNHPPTHATILGMSNNNNSHGHTNSFLSQPQLQTQSHVAPNQQQQQQQFQQQQGIRSTAPELGSGSGSGQGPPTIVLTSNHLQQQPYNLTVGNIVNNSATTTTDRSSSKNGTPILTTTHTGVVSSVKGIPTQSIQQTNPYYINSYQQYNNFNQQQKHVQGQINLNPSQVQGRGHPLPLQPNFLSNNPSSSSDQTLSSANGTKNLGNLNIKAKSPRIATNINPNQQQTHPPSHQHHHQQQNTFHISAPSLNESMPNLAVPPVINESLINYSQHSQPNVSTINYATQVNVLPPNALILTNANNNNNGSGGDVNIVASVGINGNYTKSKNININPSKNNNATNNKRKKNGNNTNSSIIGKAVNNVNIGTIGMLQKPQGTQLQSSASIATVTQRFARSRTPYNLSPYAGLAKHQSDYIQGTVMRPQLEQTLQNNPYQHQPLFYDQLINFPRARYMDDLRCVMCGLKPHPKEKELNAFGESSDPQYCIIPRQNKDVCKECDKGTWYHIGTNQYFKWCKGCKKFLKLTDFIQKLDASKCDRCRERGRVSYIEKKKTIEEINTNKGKIPHNKFRTDSEEYENDMIKESMSVEETKSDYCNDSKLLPEESEETSVLHSSEVSPPILSPGPSSNFFQTETKNHNSQNIEMNMNETSLLSETENEEKMLVKTKTENNVIDVVPLKNNDEQRIQDQRIEDVLTETKDNIPLIQNKNKTIDTFTIDSQSSELSVPSSTTIENNTNQETKTSSKVHGALNQNTTTLPSSLPAHFIVIETKQESSQEIESIPHGSAGSTGISNKVNTLEYGIMKNGSRDNTVLHRGDSVAQTITPPPHTYPTTSAAFNCQPHVLDTHASDGTNITNPIIGNSTRLLERERHGKSITTCSSTSFVSDSEMNLNYSNDSTYVDDDQSCSSRGVDVLKDNQPAENFHHSFSNPPVKSNNQHHHEDNTSQTIERKKFEEQEALIAQLKQHISNIEGDFHKTKTENNLLQKQIQEYRDHGVKESREDDDDETMYNQKHEINLNISQDNNNILEKDMYVKVNHEFSSEGRQEISSSLSPSSGNRKRPASDMSQSSDHQEDVNKRVFEMESTLSMSTKTANTNVNQFSSDSDARSSVISQDQGSLEEKTSQSSSFDKCCEEMKLFSEAKKTKLMSVSEKDDMTQKVNVQI